jgi:predicted DNA-binding transcriptional regulator YafY
VRAEIEKAWFEQRALRITYVDGKSIESVREVTIRAVAMDRHETRIDAVDRDDGTRRLFRLDRIERAEALSYAGGDKAPASAGCGSARDLGSCTGTSIRSSPANAKRAHASKTARWPKRHASPAKSR